MNDTVEKPAESCKTCRFWDPAHAGSSEGVCRRYPPQFCSAIPLIRTGHVQANREAHAGKPMDVMDVIAHADREAKSAWRQPFICDDGWCGEYQPKPGAAPLPTVQPSAFTGPPVAGRRPASESEFRGLVNLVRSIVNGRLDALPCPTAPARVSTPARRWVRDAIEEMAFPGGGFHHHRLHASPNQIGNDAWWYEVPNGTPDEIVAAVRGVDTTEAVRRAVSASDPGTQCHGLLRRLYALLTAGEGADRPHPG